MGRRADRRRSGSAAGGPPAAPVPRAAGADPADPGGGTGALVEPALLAKLERLQLGTRNRLAGRFSGEHRSVRYGTSLDFADYREYHPGDDFRRIDYSLYARTDQLFIRLFEAEDDLALRILLDTSSSMSFHGKWRQAARLAAALGFVGIIRRDAVQLFTVPTGKAHRFNGRGAVPVMMRHLEQLVPDGPTDVDAAATALLARAGLPGQVWLHRQPARSYSFWALAAFLASSPMLIASGLKLPSVVRAGLLSLTEATAGHSLLPSAK